MKKLHWLTRETSTSETQYEFSKKQLKRLIEKHLEFAKREYEKLNYERAIIEWKQVLALTLDDESGSLPADRIQDPGC
jgi:hypothetical protein